MIRAEPFLGTNHMYRKKRLCLQGATDMLGVKQYIAPYSVHAVLLMSTWVAVKKWIYVCLFSLLNGTAGVNFGFYSQDFTLFRNAFSTPIMTLYQEKIFSCL